VDGARDDDGKNTVCNAMRVSCAVQWSRHAKRTSSKDYVQTVFQSHLTGVSFCRQQSAASSCEDKMRSIYLADESEHVAGDVALSKTSASVCEEVLPLALERVVVGLISQYWVILCDEVFGQVGLKTPSPLAKCAWVV
jgi:hypothetical protein